MSLYYKEAAAKDKLSIFTNVTPMNKEKPTWKRKRIDFHVTKSIKEEYRLWSKLQIWFANQKTAWKERNHVDLTRERFSIADSCVIKTLKREPFRVYINNLLWTPVS